MKRLALVIVVAGGCSSGRTPERTAQAVPGPDVQRSVSQATIDKGLALERQGDLNGALQQYRNAYEANPEAEHTAANLARLLARRGDRNSAASIITAGLKRRPEDPELFALAATVARLQADNVGAHEYAKQALTRKPLDPHGTVELARTLVNEKKLTLAAAMVERAIAAHPEDARLHVAAADIAHASGDDSRALAELLAADQRDASVQLRIGSLALAHRDYGRARTAYEKAVALGDTSGAGQAGVQLAQQVEPIKEVRQ